MKIIMTEIITLYQRFVSPLFSGRCRFYPSCSEYALQAFENYGFFKATYLASMRILRCHPLYPGGYDPLP